MDPEVIKREGVIDPELVKKGISYEEKNLFEIPSMNMPTPDSIKTKPELGFAAGSLFLDTLTQIITGKIDPDKGFDDFVANWKKRGGDQAIKDANDWYAKNKKK
jgi:putative aldouronate transport system substrate-binding protein